ncbi:solute carrier family 23 member 1-like [Lytechinus pictus]|uniref:solute carrier family 23 member 1-like n=1 Tax=Lytechinus pictus TaxID=7653 RepID=UPI0030BA26FF
METAILKAKDGDGVIVMEGQNGDLGIQGEARRRADRILSKLTSRMMYKLSDRPPWSSTLVLAFQHFILMFGGCVALPFILGPILCIEGNITLLSKFFATICFLSGLQTFIMTTIGVRLPIVQGPHYVFILPIISMMRVRGPCPAQSANSTNTEDNPEFYSRMQEVQGAMMVSSLCEMALGVFGVISFLMKFIGPLTIATTITTLILSLAYIITDKCGVHWGVAAFTIVVIVLCSQYIDRYNVPCPGYSKAKGCHLFRYPAFRLFPVFFATTLGWILCYILTVTDAIPNDPNSPSFLARTDAYGDGVARTQWFYFPYPGQWGMPTVSAGGVFGMCAAGITSVVQSIGDYYICARLSGAPSPPDHALNRGIGIEGLGGFLAGIWGAGVPTTSYPSNISVIGLTKVSSLLVIQVMCIFLVGFGIFLKIGAAISTIPEPVIGGIVAILLGLVLSAGMSNLQFVDMNSPRNLFIVGFSITLGICLSDYLAKYPDAIQTGSATADQIISVLLGTSVFVTSVTCFFFDNTIRGTPAERGMGAMIQAGGDDDDDDIDDDELKKEVSRLVREGYDFPYGMSLIRACKYTSKIPFCPTYTPTECSCIPKFRFWKRKSKKYDEIKSLEVEALERLETTV